MPHLPRATGRDLLAAIPHMQPWLADETKRTWALREPGKQILIFKNSGTDFDLSAETGAFRVKVVNRDGGEVTPGPIVQGGGMVKLPDAQVIWLVKE